MVFAGQAAKNGGVGGKSRRAVVSSAAVSDGGDDVPFGRKGDG